MKYPVTIRRVIKCRLERFKISDRAAAKVSLIAGGEFSVIRGLIIFREILESVLLRKMLEKMIQKHRGAFVNGMNVDATNLT